MEHVNARDVLPPELLKELQRHCSGYIYVPETREFYEERRREVIKLRRQGAGTHEIAQRVHLCERRVRQLVAKAQETAHEDDPVTAGR